MLTNELERTSKVIYDVGSNNGDDLPYYLKKGDIVVAIEANPTLAQGIRYRFSREIGEKRLYVENCVLVADGALDRVPFFLHKTNSVLSQFPKPHDAQLLDFDEVLSPSRTVLSLIREYGLPYYVKVDIEHYDSVILEQLFRHDVRPPFISAEAHGIECFALLVSLGRYKSFNLVDGRNVSDKYKSRLINTVGGAEMYSFPAHSAGPFGDDIEGPWMTADNFFRFLAFEGLGWKDIHATSVIPPDLNASPRLQTYALLAAKAKARNFFLQTFKSATGRILRSL